MMQIVLTTDAIDDTDNDPEAPSAAEDLLRRLGFAPCTQIEAVHVIPPPVYTSYAPEVYIQVDDFAEIEAEERTRCKDRGAKIAARTTKSSYPCKSTVLEGPVLLRLLERAEKSNAELIAVNCYRKSGWGAFVEGSIVRSLVTDARCSLLIAKPGETAKSSEAKPAPFSVVLATDHSEYATRCIEKLLRMAPRGITHLTVLTAYPKDELHSMGLYRAVKVAVPLEEAVEETLSQRNAALIERLKDQLSPTIDYSSRVVAGDVHEAITAAMTETGADLLILGARGHGFIERLTLGSVSYREAIASPHSVLVLRD